MAWRSGNPYGAGAAAHESSEVLLKRLFRRIGEVSTLPAMAVRIIEVANDSTTGAEDLHDAIRFDAALATRIMRTVNSSYYALQNKVADLKLAITLLGFKEIRNLAMTAYIAQLFKKESGDGAYSRAGLWNHLIGVATVARLVAESSHHVPPREAYLAGLLHDLGLILIDQYLHKPFARVIEALNEETPICETEHSILGFDHAQLGEFVATQWNLPDHLTAPIGYHHSLMEYDGEHRDMVFVVTLANFFCNLKRRTSLGVPNLQAPPEELFLGLGLNKPQIAAIWERLDQTLEAANIVALLGEE